MSASKLRIVVIGGGYAGVTVAGALEKKFDVTLIDRNDILFHSVAAARAIADASGAWVPRVLVPHKLVFGKFIKASVQHIDSLNKSVTLDSGQKLEYDFLVIATGSSAAWPAKPEAPDFWSRENIVARFKEVHANIKKSKSIVIIGGGAVGVELAGELRFFNPDKEVTVIHSGAHLVADGFAPKFYKKLDEQLHELSVRVIRGSKGVVEGGTTVPSGGLFALPTVGPCTVKAGEESISADLVFNCIGIKLNNKLVQDSFPEKLDEHGQLKVNKFLQVEGLSNVLACGDIAARDRRKLAFVAEAQAKLVVKNILRLSKGQTLADNDCLPAATPCIISLGPNLGVFQLPVGNMVLGRIASRSIKSKDLFCSKNFKQAHTALPALQPSAEGQFV